MTCRRCSECVGQEHHWIENCEWDDESDPEYQCKHCDAYCRSLDDDDGFPYPSGKVVVGYDPTIAGECVRDDSTECDCLRCVAGEDSSWREQGEQP